MRPNASMGVKGYNHSIHFGFMATCPIDRPESWRPKEMKYIQYPHINQRKQCNCDVYCTILVDESKTKGEGGGGGREALSWNDSFHVFDTYWVAYVVNVTRRFIKRHTGITRFIVYCIVCFVANL